MTASGPRHFASQLSTTSPASAALGRCAITAEMHSLQVEATKFTEVGFHGRDVDQIVRDLVDAAIISTRAKMRRQLKVEISRAVEDKILDSLVGPVSENGPNTTRVR